MAYTRKIRKYKKAYRAKKATTKVATIKRVVNSVLNKQEEIKQYYVDSSIATLGMQNNTISTNAPLQVLGTMGVGDGQRISKQIFVKNVLMNLRIRSSGPELIGDYRVIAVWKNQKLNLSSGNWSLPNLGVAPLDLFFQSFAADSRMVNGFINHKLDGNIIYDKVHRLTSGQATNPSQVYIPVHLKVNKKITYQDTPTQYWLKDRELYVLVIPCIAGNATGSTVAHTLSSQTYVSYKDA